MVRFADETGQAVSAYMMDQNVAMRDRKEALLAEFLASLDARDEEALFYAAVPQWFPADLYSALDPETGAEELDWISEFSFVSKLPGGRTDFMMQATERGIINDLFIKKQPDLYREAHGRALNYWLEHPYSDPVVQAQNVLYHRILVDPPKARQDLIDLFERYVDDRQLGAMEQLLKAAAEAYDHLTELQGSDRSLQELITLMEARQKQLYRDWEGSIELLDSIKSLQAPELEPFISRAYGYACAGMRDYGCAIDYFQRAIDQFEKIEDIWGIERVQAERAITLITMGDAYIDLTGTTITLDELRQRRRDSWSFVRGLYYLLMSLPLAVAMTRVLGRRAWLPTLWSIWRYVDWIIAKLYVQGSGCFHDAGRLSDKLNRPDIGLVADEKLADLFLDAGDADAALEIYQVLLSQANLSEYRRARIQVGLGQTLWLLDDGEKAERILQDALAILQYFGDELLEARAEAVLGSIAANSSEPEAAVDHYRRALDIYLTAEPPNLTAATDVAEQLDDVANLPALKPEDQENARAESERVTERHYPVGQRFAITKFFQQIFLGTVIVLGGVGLLNAIRVESTTLLPTISYKVGPLLNIDESFNPALSQGMKNIAINDPSKLETAFMGILVMFLAYVIVSTLGGLFWLRRFDSHKIQDERISARVRLSSEGIAVGEMGEEQSISFADVRRFIINNTRVIQQLTPESYFLLETASVGQVVVSGSTAHYQELQKHIDDQLSDSVERVDLSHSLLVSWAGILLLITVLIYLILVVLSRVSQGALGYTVAHPYSVASFYPHLLLGFLIPPLFWFVWKPLQRSHHRDTFDWVPFLPILIGLLIAVGMTIFGFRVKLTTPDLYPALVAIILVSAGVAAVTARTIRQRRIQKAKEMDESALPIVTEDELLAVPDDDVSSWMDRVESFSSRLTEAQRLFLILALFLLFILVAFFMVTYLVREIQTNHLKVEGDAFRDQAIEQREQGKEEWKVSLGASQASYGKAIEEAKKYRWPDIHPQTLADIYTNRGHAYLVLGTEEISQTHTVTETIKTHRGNYELALKDYTEAIGLQPEEPQYYLWRAITQHDLGNLAKAKGDYDNALRKSGLMNENGKIVAQVCSPGQEEEVILDSQNVIEALTGLGSRVRSLRQAEEVILDPQNVVKALTGRGWIYYEREEYKKAEEDFKLAVKCASNLEEDVSLEARIEATIALGYTYYRMRRFDDAFETLLAGEEQDPQNTTLLTSLGVVEWRLGTLGENYEKSGTDRCTYGNWPEEEKVRVTDHLESAVNYLTNSAEIEDQEPEDRALTYKLRAQVQYLLRNCPGYIRVEAYQDAVNSYTKALEYDAQNPLYWYMRARLGYALWLNLPDNDGPVARETVVKAFVDLNEKLRLDGKSCPDAGVEACDDWYPAIYSNATDAPLAIGYDKLDLGEYEDAKEYFELLTDHLSDLPEIYEAHLGLGLAELALGNLSTAQDWFESGISGAVAAGDKRTINQTWKRLRAFGELDPPIDSRPVEAIFKELDFDYDVDTEAVFDRSAETLANGDIDQAIDAYEVLIDFASLDLLKAAILDLLERPQEDQEEILELFRQRLPDLERVASKDNAVKEAFDLAFIAWALGEPESAGKWYQEAIRRTAYYPANYSRALRPSRDDFEALWSRGVEVDADKLIAAMDAYRLQQIQADPELSKNHLYWRYLGWFKYFVAWKAFLAGEPDIAFAVLESAKEDALIAFYRDADTNSYVYDYLHQGAWPFYHILRGDAAIEDGDYEEALADYKTALDLYPEEITEEDDAQGEAVQAAFKAGLASYLLGQRLQALQWYQTGVELEKSFERAENLEELVPWARETVQGLALPDETAEELKNDYLSATGSDQED